MSQPATETLAHSYVPGRPLVVFLHAFPLDRRMWQPQLAALGAAGALAMDLPGFGASRSHQAPPDLDRWAELVESTITTVAGPGLVTAVGLSMGGYVALRFAALFPSRLTALVLADTRAAANSPLARAARDEAIARLRSGDLASLTDELLARLLAPSADAVTVRRVRGFIAEQDPVRLAAALRAMRDRPDSSAVLARLEVPVLVMVGGEDALTPPDEASVMASAAPAGGLEVIPGAGHLSNLERPEAFNRALEAFLARLPSTNAGQDTDGNGYSLFGG